MFNTARLHGALQLLPILTTRFFGILVLLVAFQSLAKEIDNKSTDTVLILYFLRGSNHRIGNCSQTTVEIQSWESLMGSS